jgi:hypothetical protein
MWDAIPPVRVGTHPALHSREAAFPRRPTAIFPNPVTLYCTRLCPAQCAMAACMKLTRSGRCFSACSGISYFASQT